MGHSITDSDYDREDVHVNTIHTRLCNAARKGHVEAVRLYLAQGADVNAWVCKGNTALHEAVLNFTPDVQYVPPTHVDYLSCVEELLNEERVNASLQNARGDTVLHTAVMKGNTEVVGDLVRKLCNRGVFVNARNSKGERPLHIAVELENTHAVSALVEAKADPDIANDEGDAPLHISVGKDVSIAEILLHKASADPNARNRHGATPLHRAVSLKDIDTAKLLIENGTDLNIQDSEGDTPLHITVRDKTIDITKVLLSKKPRRFCNTFSNLGDTALHVAIKCMNAEAVDLLVKAGADVNIQDGGGNTPLHAAIASGWPIIECEAVLKTLIDYGADRSFSNGFETPQQKMDAALEKALFEGCAERVEAWVRLGAVKTPSPSSEASPRDSTPSIDILLLARNQIALVDSAADAEDDAEQQDEKQ
eukprot:TRINITY_DN12994_c0_g1_i1.p1 TRINITY_DN12994_c0_g1~~TRINITY_DN12994_c0_g1_i1.p1  ORF type:complete len:422 (+),score=74.38 TRINITY_DN12994_c0_g1_i1:48-1313(+)